MQGTINVAQVMDDYRQRQEALQEWWERHQRLTERFALDEYWAAKGEGQEEIVKRLYGDTLTRAFLRVYGKLPY